MSAPHDKVMVIVEETVQHIYLLDPDKIGTREVYEALPRLLQGDILEGLPMLSDKPPAVLGKRAKKGVPMPGLLHKHSKHDTYGRFTGVTFVIPDEHGKPSLEVKATPNSIQTKPVKA